MNNHVQEDRLKKDEVSKVCFCPITAHRQNKRTDGRRELKHHDGRPQWLPCLTLPYLAYPPPNSFMFLLLVVVGIFCFFFCFSFFWLELISQWLMMRSRLWKLIWDKPRRWWTFPGRRTVAPVRCIMGGCTEKCSSSSSFFPTAPTGMFVENSRLRQRKIRRRRKY